MKTPSQPRAIYYIVAIQIWEYFSFYGMRALLILYLTHQLGFDDNHAISLFSAYASLVYVTPILGGWRHVYRFVDFLKRSSSFPVHA